MSRTPQIPQRKLNSFGSRSKKNIQLADKVTFEEGLVLHKNGNLAEAKTIYESILKVNPKQFHALHMLGAIAIQSNNFQAAIDLITLAIEANPNIADFYSNRGVAFQNINNYEKAIHDFDRAITIQPQYLDAHFNRGLALFHLHELTKSVESFDKAISINPQHALSYFNRGVALEGLNKILDATISYEKAISIKPDYWEAHFNLGHALQELKKPEEAIKHYNKVISLAPNFAEAFANRGLAFQELRRFEEAIASYDKAVDVNPNYVQAYSNRGNALQELSLFVDAINSYKKALSIDPLFIEAYSNMGTALHELSRFDDAIESYEKAITIKPDFAEAFYNLGRARKALNQFEESIVCFDKAINLKNNYDDAWCNKGVALHGLKRYKEAIRCYDKSIESNHNNSEAWSNKGATLAGLRQYEEAISHYEKSLIIKPMAADIQVNLAHAYLNIYNFTLGWNKYEWRLESKKNKAVKLITSKPAWTGAKNHGKLFIWAEQGIGDQIMYSSIFKELQAFSQKKIVSLDRKLIPLYQRSFPQFIFYEKNKILDETEYEEHIPIASLGRLFRKNLYDFKNSEFPYLLDDKEKTKEFTTKYKKPGKITCGISWKSANPDVGEDKSIPLDQLYDILKLDLIDFINLQYQNGSFGLTDQEKIYGSNINSIDCIDIYNDIDSVASIISACDVIITCSNSTAHLAGALNKPTLLILPYASGRFWYWSEYEGRSLWYSSVKIFTQKNPLSWFEVIEEVKEYLLDKFIPKK